MAPLPYNYSANRSDLCIKCEWLSLKIPCCGAKIPCGVEKIPCAISLRVIKPLRFFNDVAAFYRIFSLLQGISYAGVWPAEEG